MESQAKRSLVVPSKFGTALDELGKMVMEDSAVTLSPPGEIDLVDGVCHLEGTQHAKARVNIYIYIYIYLYACIYNVTLIDERLACMYGLCLHVGRWNLTRQM